MAFSCILCSARMSRGNVAFDSTEEKFGEWCQSSRMNVIASQPTAGRTSRFIQRTACVPPPESGLGSSHGACPYWRPPSAPYVCRAGTFSAGGLLHFARQVCMAGPVNRACEDLHGLTSGWSGSASAGRSPAIHSASAQHGAVTDASNRMRSDQD
jgi:hypothetical protein